MALAASDSQCMPSTLLVPLPRVPGSLTHKRVGRVLKLVERARQEMPKQPGTHAFAGFGARLAWLLPKEPQKLQALLVSSAFFRQWSIQDWTHAHRAVVEALVPSMLPLVEWSVKEATQVFHATVSLLYFWQTLALKMDSSRDFQILAIVADVSAVLGRALALMKPGAFETAKAQIFETECCDMFCFKFVHGGRWHFVPFEAHEPTPVMWGQKLSTPEFYSKRGVLPSILSQGQPMVSEGCCVRVTVARPADFIALGTNMLAVLSFLHLPTTEENWQWAQKVAEEKRWIVILHRNHGLTHPEAPFIESSVTPILEDESEVSRWKDVILPELGIDPTRLAFVPFTMPPALTDADRRWQQAFLDDALQESHQTHSKLLDATCAVLLEDIGEDIDLVAELDETELQQTLSGARALISEAMKLLHIFITEASGEAVEEVAWKEKLREEWRRREQWVQSQSVERRAPKKGKNKGRTPASAKARARPAKADIKRKLRDVVELAGQRAALYKHTARSMTTLERVGALSKLSPEQAARMRDAREQLALSKGPYELLEGEVLMLRLKGCRRDSSTDKSGTHVMHAPQFPTYMSLLDEATRRDRESATAHANESALKFGTQMSLAEKHSSEDKPVDESASQIGAQVLAANHQVAVSHTSANSIESFLTVASAPPRLYARRCFLPKTKFLAAIGDAEFISAARLKAKGGDILCGPDGGQVRVLKRTTLPKVERDFVRFTVESSRMQHHFAVTADHSLQVVTVTGNATIITAGELLAGNGSHQIVTGAGPRLVTSVESFRQATEVIEIAFENNSTVLAWTPSSRWTHARTLSPSLGIACRGAATGGKEALMEAGIHTSRGFLTDEPASTWTSLRRALSHGANPHTPLWFSEGAKRHRMSNPHACRVCKQHQKHLSGASSTACGKGVKCSRCHMPHDSNSASLQ